jgi:hypothetical protein
MSHQISQQHPAVVLRSHYVHMRALLGIAMIAVVGLTVTVVLLVTRENSTASASLATPASLTTANNPRGVAIIQPKPSTPPRALTTATNPRGTAMSAGFGIGGGGSGARKTPVTSSVGAGGTSAGGGPIDPGYGYGGHPERGYRAFAARADLRRAAAARAAARP